MRVIPNGSGCEVFLTGFQLPGMSDEEFLGALAVAKNDLKRLKNLLETSVSTQ